MKTFLSLLPVIISFIVLAAHFLRNGVLLFVFACLAFPFLLLVRKPWIVWVTQIVLALGAIEWVITTYGYINERQALGQSWDRLALILGIVALFTAASTIVFRLKSLRARYGNLKSKI